jgi:hypothetical protein
MTSPDPFWREFFARAEHALLLLASSTITLLFLVGLWIAVSWLTDTGRGAVAAVSIVVYLIVALPVLLAQLSAVGDLVFVYLSDSALVVPALRKVTEEGVGGWRLRAFAGLLTTTSPFAPISTWAWSVAVPSASAIHIAVIKYQTESAVMAAAWRRFRKPV